MSGESARSLRKAVISVGALGALSLTVPASLWLSPSGVFPVLEPVGHTVHARLHGGGGAALDRPARLRPGSSTEIVVTGFEPNEPVELRSSPDGAPFSGGRADYQGVFHYRLTVPASMSGAHTLTVIGAGDDSRPLPGWAGAAVFRYVVSAGRAGDG